MFLRLSTCINRDSQEILFFEKSELLHYGLIWCYFGLIASRKEDDGIYIYDLVVISSSESFRKASSFILYLYSFNVLKFNFYFTHINSSLKYTLYTSTDVHRCIVFKKSHSCIKLVIRQ